MYNITVAYMEFFWLPYELQDTWHSLQLSSFGPWNTSYVRHNFGCSPASAVSLQVHVLVAAPRLYRYRYMYWWLHLGRIVTGTCTGGCTSAVSLQVHVLVAAPST